MLVIIIITILFYFTLFLFSSYSAFQNLEKHLSLATLYVY
jgi:type II secretory pathway pseudopilin PulG